MQQASFQYFPYSISDDSSGFNCVVSAGGALPTEVPVSSVFESPNGWTNIPSDPTSYPVYQLSGHQHTLPAEVNYLHYWPSHSREIICTPTLEPLPRSVSEVTNNTTSSSNRSSSLTPNGTASQTSIVIQRVTKIGPGEWKCEVCKRTFSRNDRARAHEARHDGVFAYPCEGGVGHKKCGRSFVSPEALRSHCNRSDTVCNQCNATVRKRNLARHLRECHTSEATRYSPF